MTSQTLQDDLQRTFWALRGACTDLLASISADPENPRALGRRLGVDKNLAWKVSRLVGAQKPRDVLPHLPGPAGLEILLKAVRREGAPDERIRAVRDAVREFDGMVRAHCGDRATLELILDGMESAAGGGGLEKSRKLAFQGNRGIWGLQAETQVTSFFVAPSADGTMLDMAILGGMLGFRRLRGDATWPLFRRSNVNDAGQPVAVHAEPLDPAAEDPTAFLVRDFCEGPLPEIRSFDEGSVTRYEFAPGPVGNLGAFSFITGQIARGTGSRYASEDNRTEEFHALLGMPMETLLLDLFFHRELDFLGQVEFTVHGRLRGGPTHIGARRESDLLPVSEEVESIGQGPPVPSTPLFPRYPELVELVFERTGWDPSDFGGRRVVLRYPPIPSVAILQAALPPAP